MNILYLPVFPKGEVSGVEKEGRGVGEKGRGEEGGGRGLGRADVLAFFRLYANLGLL